jgi:hypothetical protein
MHLTIGWIDRGSDGVKQPVVTGSNGLIVRIRADTVRQAQIGQNLPLGRTKSST